MCPSRELQTAAVLGIRLTIGKPRSAAAANARKSAAASCANVSNSVNKPAETNHWKSRATPSWDQVGASFELNHDSS